MNIITVVFCVLVIAAVSICQRTDDWTTISEECKKKTNATDEDIKSVINKQIPKTREAACFLACTKRMTGVRTADFKLNMTVINDSLLPLKASNKDMYEKTCKIIQDCIALEKETSETDECVVAQKFSACVVPKREALMKPAAEIINLQIKQ